MENFKKCNCFHVGHAQIQNINTGQNGDKKSKLKKHTFLISLTEYTWFSQGII